MNEWRGTMIKPGVIYEVHATKMGHMADQPMSRDRTQYDSTLEKAADLSEVCGTCPLPDCKPSSKKCLLRRRRKRQPSRRRVQVAEMYQSGKSVAEIAGILGLTRNTIYTHLQNAGIEYNAKIGRPKTR